MVVFEEFGADKELKSLYKTYASITIFGGFLWWVIPLVVILAFFIDLSVVAIIAISVFSPIVFVFGFTLYWIPKFHASIKYVLEDDEIVVSRGVWWKTKSIVPYNRVTNVNIYQGPISRYFGIGRLSIQTAGFSGVNSSGNKTAEADFVGINNFEETRETVMNFVKGRRPVSVEAAPDSLRDNNVEVLEELRRIRKAVEK